MSKITYNNCDILIEIRDGCAELVKAPTGLTCIQRDYDTEAADHNQLRRDESDVLCFHEEWTMPREVAELYPGSLTEALTLKPIYRVTIREIEEFVVEVEADSEERAEEIAHTRLANSEDKHGEYYACQEQETTTKPVIGGTRTQHARHADRIVWHGYSEGAIEENQVIRRRTVEGHFLVFAKNGGVFNCHPLAFDCGGKDSWGYCEGNKMERIHVTHGCYPIRWKLGEHEQRQLELIPGYAICEKSNGKRGYRYATHDEAAVALHQLGGDRPDYSIVSTGMGS